MLCSVPPWTIPPTLKASSTTSAQVTLAGCSLSLKLQAHTLKVRTPKASLTDLLLPDTSGLVNGTISHLAARFIISELL